MRTSCSSTAIPLKSGVSFTYSYSQPVSVRSLHVNVQGAQRAQSDHRVLVATALRQLVRRGEDDP